MPDTKQQSEKTTVATVISSITGIKVLKILDESHLGVAKHAKMKKLSEYEKNELIESMDLNAVTEPKIVLSEDNCYPTALNGT